MILILSIITFVLTLVATGASPCMFVPNDSLQCLEFLTSENMKLGCINSLQPLECTVLTHDMDGVTLIGVKISKKQIDTNSAVFVRLKDGHCLENCCANKDRTSRLLVPTFHDCTTDAECNNHGNCKNGGCICAVNYWGQFCQHGCSSTTCHIHGRCVNLPFRDDYFCYCNHGYTGRNCEQGSNEEKQSVEEKDCSSKPCNNGTCINSPTGYTCVCNRGYRGRNCEEDTCRYDSDCQNGGSCSSAVCICSPGHWGLFCEHTDYNCSTNPCIHGRCIGLPKYNTYKCACDKGYTGRNCTQEADPCTVVTCHNNGRCSSGSCVCQDGYYGPSCQYQK